MKASYLILEHDFISEVNIGTSVARTVQKPHPK